MDSFRATVDRKKECTVVHVSGEVDVLTSPLLRAALCHSEIDTKRVVLDMSEVTFIDSTGLTVLVGANKRFGGAFRCVINERSVLRLLQVTGLHDVLAIYADVESACSEVAA